MPGFLDSYLVRLGFSADPVQYGRFQAILREASNLVDINASNIAKKFLTIQTGITGAFAGIGAGFLGLADNVAMADQEYRLFALRMYTSLPVARELKIAMDALGQPLENIAWDPELAARFHRLVEDQKVMTKELGPDFENQMLRIRDVRFEFSRFGVELKYLTFLVIKDFARAFGTDVNGLLERFRNFNNWLIKNMPRVSKWIVTNLKPVLMDVRTILGETAQVAQLTGTAFANLIGLLSRDKSLEGTALSFDKIARAIQTALGWMTEFVKGIIDVETAALHVINAAVLLKEHKYGAAAAEMKIAGQSITPTSGMVGGMVLGAPGGPAGIVVGGAIGLGAGEALQYHRDRDQALRSAQQVAPGYAAAAAAQLGIPASWIIAQEAVETGGFKSLSMALLNNLGGIMNPGGEKAGLRGFRSVGDYNAMYVSTIQDKIKRWGHVPASMHEFVQMLYGEGRNSYVQSGRAEDYLANMQRFSGTQGPVADHVETNVSVYVNVTNPNATADEIANKVGKKVAEAQQKQTQRNLAEFSAPGWSY
jgi:hypothetical protein